MAYVLQLRAVVHEYELLILIVALIHRSGLDGHLVSSGSQCVVVIGTTTVDRVIYTWYVVAFPGWQAV